MIKGVRLDQRLVDADLEIRVGSRFSFLDIPNDVFAVVQADV